MAQRFDLGGAQGVGCVFCALDHNDNKQIETSVCILFCSDFVRVEGAACQLDLRIFVPP